MLIYLASPYSHPDPAVRVSRFDAVCRAASRLMRDGVHLYSPIVHCHPLAVQGGLPTSWEFWEQYDRKIIAACGEVWVCTMDGWRESKGVTAEIKIAEELGLPVRFVSP